MATHTDYLNLTKPDVDDNIALEPFNDNMDTIDGAISSLNDTMDSLSDAITWKKLFDGSYASGFTFNNQYKEFLIIYKNTESFIFSTTFTYEALSNSTNVALGTILVTTSDYRSAWFTKSNSTTIQTVYQNINGGISTDKGNLKIYGR